MSAMHNAGKSVCLRTSPQIKKRKRSVFSPHQKMQVPKTSHSSLFWEVKCTPSQYRS